MKGLVFNLLEEVIIANYGEAGWDELLDTTELTGTYTSLGSYPDEEMDSLVAAASTALGCTRAEVLRWFGREAIPLLAQRYTKFFDAHTSTRSFVLSLNTIIHPEVRKLYAGAHCPHFRFQDDRVGALLIGYQSPRRLCELACGFIDGASAHYQETVELDHMKCMADGDDECLLRMAVR